MAEIAYANSVTRNVWEKLGESPSLLDFSPDNIGNGVLDCTSVFSSAMAAATARGAMQLHLPEGYTFLVNSPVQIPAGVRLRIWGRGIVKRGSNMTAGKGVFDATANASEWRVEGIRIDPNVTTPTGKQYGTFGGIGGDDPMHADLTLNSAFWIHEGNRDFDIDGVEIIHTGGYAVLVDARDGNITDGRIRVKLRNCRPHRFGTDPGDLNYGSWTSGVFIKNDGRAAAGKLYSARDLKIEVDAERITGSAVWMHSYGFDALHRNIQIEARGRDVGRDLVLVGALAGGRVKAQGRRIGYMTETDVDAPVPKWLANHYAVGVDSSGLVQGVDIQAELVSVCGGYTDLDGYSRGEVDLVCIKPESGSPEYTEDSVASIPAGVSYGTQVSDSSGNIGGQQVRISGTFRNLDGGAVRLFAAHGCFVEGCNIEHPAGAAVAPIIIGNIGTGSDQRSYDNVVTGNRIAWSPVAQGAAIQEWGTSLALPAFQATDKNWIFGNFLYGNCFEFLKDADSGSTTELRLSTVTVAAAKSDTVLRREGTGEDSYLSLYRQIGTSAADLLARVYDRFPLGGGAYGGPLLNMSKNAAAKSGSVVLANVTSLAFDHAFYGGKLLAEGFLAAKDYSVYSGFSTDADKLDDNWALLRFNKASTKWQQSVTTSAGARVWTDFAAGSGIPGGANKSVQINDTGAFYGETNLEYDKALKRLTVTGLTGTAGIVADTCFIQANQGFLAVDSKVTIQRTVATVGVFEFEVGSDGRIYLTKTDSGNFTLVARGSSAGAGSNITIGEGISGNRVSVLDFVADDTYTDYGLRLLRLNTGPDTTSAIRHRGTGILELRTEEAGAIQFLTANTARLTISGAGLITIGSTVSIDQTGNISFTGGLSGTLAASAISLPLATAANAINVPSGGVTALSLISVRNDGDSGVVLSRTSATAREYGLGVNSSGALVVRDRTGALDRLTVSTAGLITIGSTVSVDQSGNITFTGTALGSGGSAGLNVANNTATNAIQVPSGGVTAKWLVATDSLFFVELAAPAVSAAGQARLYMDSTSKKVRISQNGAAYVDLVGAGGGTPGGSDGNVQYKNGSAFAGSANLTWNDGSARLTVTGEIKAVRNDGGPGLVVSRSSATARDWGLRVTSSGALQLYDESGGAARLDITTGGVVSISSGNCQVDASGNLSAAGVLSSTGASGGVNVTAQTATNSIQTVGGMNVGSGGSANGVYRVNGTTVIDASRNGSFVNCDVSGTYKMDGTDIINVSGQFVGPGALMGASGCGAGGFNPWNGSGYDTGQTWDITLIDDGGTLKFRIAGNNYSTLKTRGGSVVNVAA